ncbi:MAG: sulfotransferase family 2 domain-containing protein [Halioglobus sp.]|nr:sulfotransferase family 2 domain-containing protein [Halioglobus sp.]
MPRIFRYSRKNYGKLSANNQHSFAQRHALNIYSSDSIYSFIPKNACSTMRTSLAIANGCIKDNSDFNWIHQNNDTFTANLSELAKAKYSFAILRCPFSRLLSVYLDKIVDRNNAAWRYVDLHHKKIGLEDITFEFFVKSMCKKRIRDADIHWRPQINFLVYEEYDDYFAFEDFPKLTETLQDKIGLELVDARPLTKHGTDGYRKLSKKEPYRLGPLELLAYKNGGAMPTLETMYNDELVACVERAYKSDIALYKRKVGSETLSFS